MVALLRLLLIVFIFSFVRHLLRRLLRNHSTKQKSVRESAKPGFPKTKTGRMVRDPLCGTFVAQELSVSVRTDGQTLHFCSSECKDNYLARLQEPVRSQAR